MKKRLPWLLLLAGVLLYGGGELFFGCLFRRLTGLPCPGCGLTRANLAFLQGDFETAFRLHPLFLIPWLLLAACVLYAVRGERRREKAVRGICAAVIALCALSLLVVYALRLGAGTIP